MNTKVIVHISHTDIRSDSRILKEIESLRKNKKYIVNGVGVVASNNMASNQNSRDPDLITLKILSKKIKVFPRFLRHTFNLLELFFKGTYQCLRLRPNIIHCHDTVVLPIGVLLKLLTGCKVVYDAHELESDKNGQTCILSKVTLLIELMCWSKIDLFITVSESIKEWYSLKFKPLPSVVILNSPISALIPTVQPKQGINNHSPYLRKLFNIDDDIPIFIYVGVLNIGRGIDLCLKAFSDSNINAHIIFMGYGPFADKIKVAEKKFKNIHMHPPVRHEDVIGVVKGADYGVCLLENVSLSDYYSLPNKLFEYCFSGIPVVACDFPEINRIVTKHKVGICISYNLKSLIKCILKLSQRKMYFEFNDLTCLSWATQEKALLSSYSKYL